MLYNYWITALRNLKKRASSTIVQVLGLAIGLTVFTLVQVIAAYEENFDTFFPNHDRIYSAYIMVKPESGFGLKSTDGVYTALQPILEAEVPDIEKSARCMGREQLVRSGENKFYESMRFVDHDFLDIFELEFIYGNASEALDDPTSVILSESLAKKYYRDQNPLGEILTVETRHELQVTGVFRDLPSNTHFTSSFTGTGTLDMIATTGAHIRINEFDPQGSWTSLSSNNMTYMLLPEGSDPHDFEARMNAVTEKYLSEDIMQFHDGFALRPLQNMNLFIWETSGIPALGAIRILGLIILLIACLNYMTLAAARGLSRLREVGLRKSIGASRGQLIFQFLVESVVIALFALAISIVLAKLVIPVVGQQIGRAIAFHPFSSPAALAGLLGLMLLTGLFAGGYPALVISRARIPDALRGDTGRLGKRNVMRNILLVIQYTSSIVLAIAVMITFAQNQKLQEGDFRYHRDHIVNVNRMSNPNIAPHYDVLRTEWQTIPGVEIVTISSQVPFQQRHDIQRVSPISGDESRKLDMQRMDIGEDFATAYDLDLLAGRYLAPQYGEDVYRVDEEREYAQSMVNTVINMKAVTALGFESPGDAVGKFFYEIGDEASDVTFRIVGVVGDVNILGFHNKIRPMAFFMPEEMVRGVASIRISAENTAETLSQIDATWDRVIPDYPIEREFLDDGFKDIFEILQGINVALIIFSVIGITLAIVGLIGMTVFLTNARTKELGVRKVLGASESRLVRMLTWQTSRPVLIALIIACPLAYFAMGAYLNFFVDRVALSPVFFLQIGVVVMIIAWLIVGIRAYRVAITNPAEVLRYE
ncbi:FtsX-like permease family protein [Candidatus Neomarinimicrobiota bacterium]